VCGEEDGGDVVGEGQSDVGWWRCGGEGTGEGEGEGGGEVVERVEVMRFAEHCEESGVVHTMGRLWHIL